MSGWYYHYVGSWLAYTVGRCQPKPHGKFFLSEFWMLPFPHACGNCSTGKLLLLLLGEATTDTAMGEAAGYDCFPHADVWRPGEAGVATELREPTWAIQIWLPHPGFHWPMWCSNKVWSGFKNSYRIALKWPWTEAVTCEHGVASPKWTQAPWNHGTLLRA